MNYEEISDFDINVRIAESLGLNWYCAAGDSPTGGWEYCSIKELMGNDDSKLKDYCNNPSDAWPIMEKYGIATIVENGIVVGATNNSQEFYEPFGSVVHSYLNTNALRAAMIVFLMMQEAKRG